MTSEQFLDTPWGADMRVRVKGNYAIERVYNVVSVDFDQELIGCDVFGEDSEPKWFRCENCELINEIEK